MYNRKGIFETEICLDYQRAILNFDILILISIARFENCPENEQKSLINVSEDSHMKNITLDIGRSLKNKLQFGIGLFLVLLANRNS